MDTDRNPIFRCEAGPPVGTNLTAFERALFGEEIPWGRSIPAVYHSLAAPNHPVPFQRAPQPGDDAYVASSYWTPLIHILRYGLGWLDMAKGMNWWESAGRPTDDPRLALIDQIWGSDGQMKYFVAQISSNGSWRRGIAERMGLDPRVTLDGDPMPKAKHDQIVKEAKATGIKLPVGGGTDPLHLEYHSLGPMEQTNQLRPTAFTLNHADRAAVVVMEATAGWYLALSNFGRTLPNVEPRSWHVDVYARPVGWLGNYRRSTETGMWFMGEHSLHMRGN